MKNTSTIPSIKVLFASLTVLVLLSSPSWGGDNRINTMTPEQKAALANARKNRPIERKEKKTVVGSRAVEKPTGQNRQKIPPRPISQYDSVKSVSPEQKSTSTKTEGRKSGGSISRRNSDKGQSNKTVRGGNIYENVDGALKEESSSKKQQSSKKEKSDSERTAKGSAGKKKGFEGKKKLKKIFGKKSKG